MLKAAKLRRTGGSGGTTWFTPQTKWQSCWGVPASILRYYDKEELQHTLSMVEYKCWYHETAQTTGTIDPHEKYAGCENSAAVLCHPPGAEHHPAEMSRFFRLYTTKKLTVPVRGRQLFLWMQRFSGRSRRRVPLCWTSGYRSGKPAPHRPHCRSHCRTPGCQPPAAGSAWGCPGCRR